MSAPQLRDCSYITSSLYQDILTPPSNFNIFYTGCSWTLPQFLAPHPKNSDIIYGWPLAMSKKMPSSQLHIYRKCTRRQSQSWVSNGYHFRPFNCQKIGFPAMPNGHCVKRTTVCVRRHFFFLTNWWKSRIKKELYSCKIEYLVKSFCNFSWILGYFTVHVNLKYDKVESKRSNTAAE